MAVRRQYCVYIMSNAARTLYIGVTNNLARRAHEHRSKSVDGFTRRYGIDELVYYEPFDDVRLALARERQIKGWRRSRKIELIEMMNPEWEDLTGAIGR